MATPPTMALMTMIDGSPESRPGSGGSDRSGEATSAQLLGELYRSTGRTALALDYLDHAVELRRHLN